MLAAASVLIGCTASGDAAISTVPAPVVPTSALPSGGPASPAASGDTDVQLGGEGLPDSWPDGLPPYPAGTVTSAVVAEGGSIVNAAWTTTKSVNDAWDAMVAALTAAGFKSSFDAGGEDMYINTTDMRSDDFSNDDFDVNVTMVPGDPVTVLLNASKK